MSKSSTASSSAHGGASLLGLATGIYSYLTTPAFNSAPLFSSAGIKGVFAACMNGWGTSYVVGAFSSITALAGGGLGAGLGGVFGAAVSQDKAKGFKVGATIGGIGGLVVGGIGGLVYSLPPVYRAANDMLVHGIENSTHKIVQPAPANGNSKATGLTFQEQNGQQVAVVKLPATAPF